MFSKLFQCRLDRRAAYAKLLRDGVFADPRSGFEAKAYDILQEQLVYNVAERLKRIFVSDFVKLLFVHTGSTPINYLPLSP